ncbi:unnamed protein product [Protopolystoma xenopodis]|uniref:Small acidic protein-like domain-containing protein n=1 Tax=Protopolystoma xenopodis TaxID=117903 RepID=A0A3S5FCK3_9PLAT|nr:unnamed protein product [Protopolystoma xenopodis]
MWSSTSLIAGKGNQQAAAKFCKLMGLGESALPEVREDERLLAAASTGEAAQSALFRRLEQEYEASRTHTHTQRGVGLGYSSHGHIDYSAYAAMRAATDVVAPDETPDAHE